MVWDTGFAPAVQDKVLSLACCKTRLRHKIAEELLHDDKGKVLTKGEENQSNDNNDSSSSRNEGTAE